MISYSVTSDGVSVAEGDARHILARFMFYGPDVFKRIADLSGGERMRLRLAQLMNQDVNFLMLDEPTNHLEIESREVLEEALEDFTGTIMAVSHDRYFLNKLFSRTAWLEGGRITMFEGPYNWARGKWQERQNCMEIGEIEPAVKKPELEKVEEVATVNAEEEIVKLELDITTLENRAVTETDWEKYDSLTKEIKALKEKLESYYEMWMDETKIDD